jgi:hypothetical protein
MSSAAFIKMLKIPSAAFYFNNIIIVVMKMYFFIKL